MTAKEKYTVRMKSLIGTRDEQQDFAFQSVTEKSVVAAVCDGMGGHESGKLASVITIEKFKELYYKKDPAEPLYDFYHKSVDILDELVFNLKNNQGGKLGAGTTFVAAAIENNNLFWLSIGDSRLYILRGDEFVQVTRDHNYFMLLEQMFREKEISRSQYQAQADKGDALISFIGMGGIEVMDINRLPFKLLQNDTVLLSTDGLYKTLNDEEIKQCLRVKDAEEALNLLMTQVDKKARQFQDNTTCVIIKYNGEAKL